MSYDQKNDFQDGGKKMAVAAILNLKKIIFWSRDCNWVQYLMQCTKFHQNLPIFH